MGVKRLAIIGDLHLNKLGHKVENHLGLQMIVLDKIVQEIRDNGLDQVVLLGDVFDKPSVKPTVIIEFLRFVLRNRDLTFHWVIGNHDRTSKAEASVDIMNELAELDALPNLCIYNKPTAVKGVGFLPYPHKKPLKNTVLSIAHVDRPGAKMDTGRVLSEKGKWDEKQYFIIGHIHTQQTVGKRSHYPGAPFQLSFGEQGDKFWAIVSYDTKDASAFRYKLMPAPVAYRLENLTIKTKKQLKKLKPHPTYYKLTFDGVKVPPTFMTKNPNVEVRGFSIKKSKNNKAMTSDQAIEVNLKYKLDEYLKANDLGDKEIKWAMKQVDAKIRSLGLAA